MKELVLLVLLESGRSALYPMPSEAVCEDWAAEAAAYPNVQAVDCTYQPREGLEGHYFVWKDGVSE